ncbi:MAG: hypothetical protein ACU0CO_05865 [Shimia sp.]
MPAAACGNTPNSSARPTRAPSRIRAARRSVTSTLISSAALLSLAGCLPGGGGGGLGFAGSTAAPTSIGTPSLATRSGLTFAAPQGYCIDPGSLRQGLGTASALAASCANLGNAEAGAPVDPAILSIASSRVGLATPAEAQAVLRTDLGRAALSRSGQATDVALHDVKASERAVYVHLTDVGPGALPGTDLRHWKAVLDVSGRAVVISAHARDGSSQAQSAGEALVRDAAAAMLAANAGTAPVAPSTASPVAASATAEVDNTPTPAQEDGAAGLAGRLAGLFRR